MAGEKKQNLKERSYTGLSFRDAVYSFTDEWTDDPVYEASGVARRYTAIFKKKGTDERYFARLLHADGFLLETVLSSIRMVPDVRGVIWPADALALKAEDPFLNLIESEADRPYVRMREGEKEGKPYLLLFPLISLDGYESLERIIRRMKETYENRPEGLNLNNRKIQTLSGKLVKTVLRMNRAGYVLNDLHLSRFLVSAESGELLLDYSVYTRPSYRLRNGKNPEFSAVSVNAYPVESADPYVMHKLLSGEPASVDYASQNVSLASVLFYWFTGRYAYEGAFLDGTREDFEMAYVDKFQKYYATSVFIFDPDDRRNALSRNFDDEARATALFESLPAFIRDIFIRIFSEKNVLRTEKFSAPGPKSWLEILEFIGFLGENEHAGESLYQTPEIWAQEYLLTSGGHFPRTAFAKLLQKIAADGGTAVLTDKARMKALLSDTEEPYRETETFLPMMDVTGYQTLVTDGTKLTEADFGRFFRNVFSETAIPKNAAEWVRYITDAVLLAAFPAAVFADFSDDVFTEDNASPLIPIGQRTEEAEALEHDFLRRAYGFGRLDEITEYERLASLGLPRAKRMLYAFSAEYGLKPMTALSCFTAEKSGGLSRVLSAVTGTRGKHLAEALLSELSEYGDTDAFGTAPAYGVKRALPEETEEMAVRMNRADTRIGSSFYCRYTEKNLMARFCDLRNGNKFLEIRDENAVWIQDEETEPGDVCMLGFGLTEAEYEIRLLRTEGAENLYANRLIDRFLSEMPEERLLYQCRISENGMFDLKMKLTENKGDGGRYAAENSERDRAFVRSLAAVYTLYCTDDQKRYPILSEEGNLLAFTSMDGVYAYIREIKRRDVDRIEFTPADFLASACDFSDDGIQNVSFSMTDPDRTVLIPTASLTDSGILRMQCQTGLNRALITLRAAVLAGGNAKETAALRENAAHELQEAVLFLPLYEKTGDGPEEWTPKNRTVYVTPKAGAVLDRHRSAIGNYVRGWNAEGFEFMEITRKVKDRVRAVSGKLPVYTDLRFRDGDTELKAVLCGNYYEISGLIYKMTEGDEMRFNGLFFNPARLGVTFPLDTVKETDEILYGKARKTELEKRAGVR